MGWTVTEVQCRHGSIWFMRFVAPHGEARHCVDRAYSRIRAPPRLIGSLQVASVQRAFATDEVQKAAVYRSSRATQWSRENCLLQ